MQKTTNSSELIRALESIFARHGIPEQVRSDNGPQFDSEELSNRDSSIVKVVPHFPKQMKKLRVK